MQALGKARWSVVLTFVVCAVSVVGLMTGARAQAPTDPQSLVGEWSGEWRSKTGASSNYGPYYVSIEKVQGKRVSGHVQARSDRGNVDYKFQGALDGNQLTWTAGNANIALTVDGTTMTGTSTGGRTNTDISLTKKK